MSGEFQKFDFKKPGGLSSDSLELARVWFRNWTSIFKEKWAQMVDTAPSFEFDSDTVYSFEVLKKQFTSPNVAMLLKIPPENLDLVLIFQRTDALNISFEMLDESNTENVDRELSDIEFSLFMLFARELVNGLCEAWPMKEPLIGELGDRVHQIHRSRMYEPRLVMLNLKFKMVREGSEDTAFHLLVPQKQFENFLTRTMNDQSDEHGNAPSPTMENKALEIEVDLSVVLGEVELKLAELNQLGAGDVIRLEQKIDEALEVIVEDQPKFKAWPGVSNQQQSVIVSQVL